MCLIDECGMLVDELRDDPAFVAALAGLRDAITAAIAPPDARGVAARYAEVAERLVKVAGRLNSQR